LGWYEFWSMANTKPSGALPTLALADRVRQAQNTSLMAIQKPDAGRFRQYFDIIAGLKQPQPKGTEAQKGRPTEKCGDGTPIKRVFVDTCVTKGELFKVGKRDSGQGTEDAVHSFSHAPRR
jgi:hypothetical protein